MADTFTSEAAIAAAEAAHRAFTDDGCCGGACTPTAPPKTAEAPLRAAELVHGDRLAAYGHPLDDFTRTGRIWGAILGLEGDVPPELVGLCLAAVKIAREVHAHGEDNLVDLAGYAETVRLVHDEREGR